MINEKLAEKWFLLDEKDINKINKKNINNILIESNDKAEQKIKYFDYFMREKMSFINYSILNSINQIEEDYKNITKKYNYNIDYNNNKDLFSLLDSKEHLTFIKKFLNQIEYNFYNRIMEDLIKSMQNSVPDALQDVKYIYTDIINDWIFYLNNVIKLSYKKRDINSFFYNFFNNDFNNKMKEIYNYKISNLEKIIKKYKNDKEKYKEIKKSISILNNNYNKRKQLKQYCVDFLNIIKLSFLGINLKFSQIKYDLNNYLSLLKEKQTKIKINKIKKTIMEQYRKNNNMNNTENINIENNYADGVNYSFLQEIINIIKKHFSYIISQGQYQLCGDKNNNNNQNNKNHTDIINIPPSRIHIKK